MPRISFPTYIRLVDCCREDALMSVLSNPKDSTKSLIYYLQQKNRVMTLISQKRCRDGPNVLQKKVLPFGPNRTVEVRPNSSAEPNVWSVTSLAAVIQLYYAILL